MADIDHSAEALIGMPAGECAAILARWKLRDYVRHFNAWPFWRRHDQMPPERDWRIWLVMAGRGYGKTRMGAEWVRSQAEQHEGARIALIGATIMEARQIMVEGESGILNLPGTSNLRWESSLRRIIWPNGAQATLYSAAEPESLRGVQHHFAWADEIAKWPDGIAVWDNLMLGMRLGDRPQTIATTTPRPVPLIRRLVTEKDAALTHGRTDDNRANLPSDFRYAVEQAYGGTRLGRQELDGELIEDLQGALWNRPMIEACRVGNLPSFRRVVIGVDPPVSSGGDACGIIAAALGHDDKAYILADHSVQGCSPEKWARAVAASSNKWQADRVVVESNQGGEMVESTLRAAQIGLPITRVHASRGKSARAEPVAALYETGRVHHAGAFPALEDQMCGLIAGGGYEGPGRSPDRADALVWAITEIMLGKTKAGPRVRIL
ncbi:DNA-packaging protein [Sphingorhabdus arenilitoris]|uniref:DNA-packaging protein n=1 Tax=Sphingorhabdus arenilitoris TaxID=1490041 RepID=A0ABV8RDR0_9SPHN